ncbi:undecaprenyl-diphosphatase [Kroppenstedtia pulmonis]|uniref:Undecaprenyl-diphosphatase n=1 Tax=Kroppenstedtia pulmonis TaxID=1380685 RepID=A0A7D4CPE4_9BACL|nr:undecaprenyl-diphosphatase [Kroppenstedtia pulmonis]QKG85278.1 undecaprenyl-diphosphatase [Kroppenstedtia pulmonis]
MDFTIFQWINGLAGENRFLDGFMMFMTDYGPYGFALILFLMLLNWRSKTQRISGLYTGATLTLALALSFGIGQLWPRERPFVVHDHVNVLLHHAADSSFPSDHTTGAFAIAFALWYHNRLLGGTMLIFALLIGISRPFVGHHYPGDVLAGIIVAFLAATVVQFIRTKWEQTGSTENTLSSRQR